MPNRYCKQCGADVADDASYCSECGGPIEHDTEMEMADTANSTDGDTWDWFNPRGPFRSPRQALRSVILLGIVTFLLSIVLNAIGFQITELPHPIPITLFAFWVGIILIGFPLWGLLHISDNVLGFLRHG